MRVWGKIGRGTIWGLAFALVLSGIAGQSQAQERLGDGPLQTVVVRDGIASVRLADTLAMPPGDRRLVRLSFPETEAPVLGEAQDGPAQAMLRRLYAAGRAAGHQRDLYDNRDRGHSALPQGTFPQLARISYGDEMRAVGLDYGPAQQLIFDAPVIGNSSTALTGGMLWRSMPRLMMTSTDGPFRLFQNYVAGQIHVYPEHRDHDPEKGDLLPANTPYYLISQGSSGSDQAHLEALAMILAAFRPDTKAMLHKTGLIAPTVQMVYRRSRHGVLNREDYLSGAAHPSVFDAEGLAHRRMVTLANAIAPDAVPPMVRLEVLEETQAREGVDYFGEGFDERLFNTPSAIARVWRSRTWRREMVVSAAATRDPNGRPLAFTWVVLRGDPAHTRIEPLEPDGRRARITMEWQDPRPVPGQPDLLSHRIDIGVFAHNGVHDSAPAFVSVFLPQHERRVYEADPAGVLRITEIDRSASDGVYSDPLIFPEVPWRDRYHYDASGRLQGWTRIVSGEAEEYDASGARSRPGNSADRVKVRYLPVQAPDGGLRLEVRETD